MNKKDYGEQTDRHGKHCTIIASQLPVEAWHQIIGEQTIADYPHFFIMRSNTTVCAVNQPLNYRNTVDYFA